MAQHNVSSLIKEKMNLEKLQIKFKSPYIAAFFLIALVSALLYLDNASSIRDRETGKDRDEGDPVALVANGTRCDLFSGKWIYDVASRPLYDEERCSFMLDDYACKKYGRKDFEYQKWRWQPHQCDLPRFNGTALLEKIRGKRVVFVGDSLNKNQWNSMLCLIESSLDQSSNKSVVRYDNLFVFKANEYNVTIEFYWSPLLMESNCDDPYTHSIRDRIVKITSIEKHAKHWNDADILIFDAFMWWLDPTMTLLWGSFGSPDAIYKKVEMKVRLYEMGLTTWSNWLEININRTKTKLFFMSISPYHFFGETWEEKSFCYNQTMPISKGSYWGINTDVEIMHVAESIIQKMETRGLNITYLNITQLSDYRNDAHPSIYRKAFLKLSEEQLLHPLRYLDCVHWCLPGVPDVWNHILYSYIMDS
ncbi:protein trichome birefringence-like 34 isoform X1 [Salvia miltiorrhiza]|uniref:protein trichome birefringence-like 34 isoform X1 n=1 Tax=Salvia miltiorrhiza TaxID=226208 RepID=UPI0025ACEF7E|nr:protein trichome birefringence-like 34 isoform X1 [Salvia miltiorrhiza]